MDCILSLIIFAIVNQKISIMNTYSFYGLQGFIHIPAMNKREAVKKLQAQDEPANMKNVFLLHRGV